MHLRVAASVAVAALTSCAEGVRFSDPSDPEPNEWFEFEPGMFVPLGGKADLPNSSFQPRILDTNGYRAIADKYVAARFDVKPTGALAAYDWPLTSSRTVLSREGTPIRLGSLVYQHTGFDIIRASETESAVVHAPVSGTAQITDWFGQTAFPSGDYSTVISIWDPATHLVLEIMHVKPDPLLPRSGLFEVQRGQALGELAAIDIPGGRHTHINVIDAERFELLDPATVFPSYPDTSRPIIDELYVLDALAMRHQSLQTGALDLVVTAHDRDDSSPRNFEIESIAYRATDDLGNVIGQLERCHLADAFKTLATDWNTSTSTIRLIDFGNATGQFGGFWPSSDVGNPDRLFRYAVTNLRFDQGRCAIVANDRDGQLVISPSATMLTVTIDVWDAHDNHETKQVTPNR